MEWQRQADELERWRGRKPVEKGHDRRRCGECLVLAVDEIRLCLPARKFRVRKYPMVTDVTICRDVVLVTGSVRKEITYEDCLGRCRTLVRHVPIDCCMKIPGARPGDRVTGAQMTIRCSQDRLQKGGRIIEEKMCVEISLTLERGHPWQG
ncbi:MAG: hypothetical protein ACOYD6_05590 [Limnochordia bacterium]|jgi:hypothetical protein